VLPVFLRFNANHNPPLVPLRRDGHPNVQVNGPAEQAVRRMALDLAVKPLLGFTPANRMLSRSGRNLSRPTNQQVAENGERIEREAYAGQCPNFL